MSIPNESDEQEEPLTQAEPARGSGDGGPPRRKTAVGCGDDSGESPAGKGSQLLLTKLSENPCVEGFLIFPENGETFAHNFQDEYRAFDLGRLARELYYRTYVIGAKLGHHHLHQLVCRTESGYVVIAPYRGGILLALTISLDTNTLTQVLRNVSDLVTA